MRKNILTFAIVISVIQCFGQQLPEDIQQVLDSLKNDMQTILSNYRINPEKRGELCSLGLKYNFPSYLRDKADKFNLNLGLIYDNEMRDRIVELMRNEYREYELDTLVDRRINSMKTVYEYRAIDSCHFDTLQIFKNALDSFYMDGKDKNSGTIYLISAYKHPVLKLLQLDTTEIFKQAYNRIRERERKRERKIFDKKSLQTY
jgi:hypothetical protein